MILLENQCWRGFSLFLFGKSLILSEVLEGYFPFPEFSLDLGWGQKKLIKSLLYDSFSLRLLFLVIKKRKIL